MLLSLAKLFKPQWIPNIFKLAFFQLLSEKNIYTLAILKNNKKINLNIGNIVDGMLFFNGSYEEKWINSSIPLIKHKTFIDVGAHIGIYSLFLTDYAKKIYAIEPELSNFNRLVSNIAINSIKNVSTFNKAVYSVNNKKLDLNLHRDSGLHSLVLASQKSKSQKVTTITLDYLIQKNKITNIGLIKIDVEGAEIEVLKGAKKTLKKYHPTILIEINKPRLKNTNKAINIFIFLKKYSYSPFQLKDGKFIKTSYADLSSRYNDNILFRYS